MEVLSGLSSTETREEHKEEEDGEEEEEEEGKHSMLKLFFMAREGEAAAAAEVRSSWTPKSLSPAATVPLKLVQVLELWPMFPQCEHFLPIFLQTTLSFLD